MPGTNRRKRQIELVMEQMAVSCVRLWALASPPARRARRWLRTTVDRGVRIAFRRRALVLSGLSRAAWWSALALAFQGTRELLAFPGAATDYHAVASTFGIGLGLCAVSVAAAPARNLRVLASAQGALHAGCAAAALVALGA